MRYQLVCCQCQAYQWVNGSLPCPDTNTVDLEEEDPSVWEGGDPNCRHVDFTIGNPEPDDDLYYGDV